MIPAFKGLTRPPSVLLTAALFTLFGIQAACAAATPVPASTPDSETAGPPAENGDPPSATAVRRDRSAVVPDGESTASFDAGLLPLLRPDRRLHYRGRSRLAFSRPDDRLRPGVGHVFSTLQLAGAEADGQLLLARVLFPYSAESRTSSVLSAPRERRRETVRLDPTAFTLELLDATSEAHRRNDRWGPAAPLRFTSDGFGLNSAARVAGQMYSVAIPRELYAALIEQGEITREYDFYLVVEDPLGDRVVVPARVGSPVPHGAERHIRGRTVLQVEGHEPCHLDRRFPSPPPSDDPRAVPLAGRPDERISLPSLRVSVSVVLVIEPAGDRGGTRIDRQDRLTWTVLDRVDEPWLLAWEGIVATETGDPLDPTLREASVSRELVRIEDTGSQP